MNCQDWTRLGRLKTELKRRGIRSHLGPDALWILHTQGQHIVIQHRDHAFVFGIELVPYDGRSLMRTVHVLADRVQRAWS